MPPFERHPGRKLTALAHGELSEGESFEVGRHLLSCAACRRKAAAIERVAMLARNPPLPEVPILLMPPQPALAQARSVSSGTRPARAWAAGFALAAAGLIVAVLALRRAGTARRESGSTAAVPLERAALSLHRERLRGAMAFDMCDGSADEVRSWVCRESGLETETPAGAREGRACASLVTAAGVPAALVAFDSRSRPLTLVTARREDLGAGWPRRPMSLRDPESGVSLRTWTDADQAFVLVSGRPGLDPPRQSD